MSMENQSLKSKSYLRRGFEEYELIDKLPLEIKEVLWEDFDFMCKIDEVSRWNTCRYSFDRFMEITKKLFEEYKCKCG